MRFGLVLPFCLFIAQIKVIKYTVKKMFSLKLHKEICYMDMETLRTEQAISHPAANGG